MENLPATRKIANKRNSTRYSGNDDDNSSKATKKKTKVVNLPDKGATNYFANKKGGKQGMVTKIRKFADSQSIKITLPEADRFLSRTFKNQPFYDAIQQLEDNNVEEAEDTLYLSLLGRNVIYYGLGDKRLFMQRFVQDYLIGEDVLSIDGDVACTASSSERLVRALINRICTSIIPNKVLYSKEMNMVNCIKDITDALNKHYGHKTEHTPVAVQSFAESAYEASDPVRATRWTTAERGEGGLASTTSLNSGMGRRVGMQSKLYIVVHNVGGPSLSSRDAQVALSLLGACPSVCIIASMEHLNTSLLWESDVAARYNWVFKHMPTFKHHPMEADNAFVCVNEKHATSTDDVNATGLKYVLASLSKKHKELFQTMCTLLCKKQEARIASGASQKKRSREVQFQFAMPRHELLKEAIAKMVVKNTEELRVLLNEYVDHGHVTLSESSHVDQVVLHKVSEAEILKAGSEELFEKSWASVTEAIKRARGGLGSVLHRTENPLVYIAYAQWPSKEIMDRDFEESIFTEEEQVARTTMRATTDKIETLHRLDVVDDKLVR